MASKKQRRDQALAEIQPYLNEWALRSGTKQAAFRDWAAQQVLWEIGLSDADIQQVTAVDGPGDFGIDGWYLQTDASPPVLHVFQSKDTAGDRKDLLLLRDGLCALFDSDRSMHANEELRLRAADFQEHALDVVEIEFYLVTSDVVPGALRTHAEALGNDPIPLFERSYPCNYTVLDVEDLSQNLQVAHDKPITIEWELELANYFEPEAGRFRTVTAAVPARLLGRLFQKERTNLFRLNPRYYQTTRTVVNKDVLGTLLGTERGDFFFLNNGLTAVSGGVVAAKDEKRGKVTLTAQDFQVVNGCQTTVTIHEAWKSRKGGEAALDGVFVLLRIIEAPPAIAPLIARTTNSQNPMKAEDFRANDERQRRLRREFDLLTPKWFYEHKRGLWTFEHRDKDSRRAYVEGEYAPRHVGMKDLAQASLAFLGSPSEASERARLTFSADEKYSRVFPESVKASQLLLPLLMFRHADQVTSAGKDRFSWSQYLRFPIVHCVSRLLHEMMGEPDQGYFSSTASETLARTIGDWNDLIEQCFEVLALEVQEQGAGGLGARSVVRNDHWLDKPYQMFKRSIRERLESEDKIAKQISKDPKTLGLRSSFPYPIRDLTR